jgi:hypothetical protein
MPPQLGAHSMKAKEIKRSAVRVTKTRKTRNGLEKCLHALHMLTQTLQLVRCSYKALYTGLP